MQPPMNPCPTLVKTAASVKQEASPWVWARCYMDALVLAAPRALAGVLCGKVLEMLPELVKLKGKHSNKKDQARRGAPPLLHPTSPGMQHVALMPRRGSRAPQRRCASCSHLEPKSQVRSAQEYRAAAGDRQQAAGRGLGVRCGAQASPRGLGAPTQRAVKQTSRPCHCTHHSTA